MRPAIEYGTDCMVIVEPIHTHIDVASLLCGRGGHGWMASVSKRVCVWSVLLLTQMWTAVSMSCLLFESQTAVSYIHIIHILYVLYYTWYVPFTLLSVLRTSK